MKYYFKTMQQLDKVWSPLDKYEASRFNRINSFVSKTTAAASKKKPFRQYRCTNRSDLQENQVLARWQTSPGSSQKSHLCIKKYTPAVRELQAVTQSNASLPHICVCVPMPSLVRQHRDPDTFVRNSQQPTARGKHLRYKNSESPTGTGLEWA